MIFALKAQQFFEPSHKLLQHKSNISFDCLTQDLLIQKKSNQKMEGAEFLVCKFNQTGYCKYGSKCNRYHENELCNENICDQNKCTKRHSKECKYFKTNNYCQFGSGCGFNHSETLSKEEFEILRLEVMNVKAEIETLKNTVKVLSVNKEEEQVLTKEIKLLKEETGNIQLDDHKMLQKIEQFEEDLTDSEDDFKDIGTATNTCEECNFTCTGEITMRKHVNTKHGSLLKSTDQSAEGLTNKCAVSDFDDFFQIEVVDGETLYVCNICNEVVESEYDIRQISIKTIRTLYFRF